MPSNRALRGSRLLCDITDRATLRTQRPVALSDLLGGQLATRLVQVHGNLAALGLVIVKRRVNLHNRLDAVGDAPLVTVVPVDDLAISRDKDWGPLAVTLETRVQPLALVVRERTHGPRKPPDVNRRLFRLCLCGALARRRLLCAHLGGSFRQRQPRSERRR